MPDPFEFSTSSNCSLTGCFDSEGCNEGKEQRNVAVCQIGIETQAFRVSFGLQESRNGFTHNKLEKSIQDYSFSLLAESRRLDDQASLVKRREEPTRGNEGKRKRKVRFNIGGRYGIKMGTIPSERVPWRPLGGSDTRHVWWRHKTVYRTSICRSLNPFPAQ